MSVRQNLNSMLCDTVMKTMLETLHQQKNKRRRAAFKNRAVNSIIDDYDLRKMQRVCKQL